jgi:uncharacterized protein YjiS (DUF1127 family)
MSTKLSYCTPDGGATAGRSGGVPHRQEPVPRPDLRRIAGAVAALASIPRTWLERRRFRAELEELDERLLKDIGLTPSEARSEASKPFWRD